MKDDKEKKQPLTDAQLVAKYDNGKPVDMEEAIKKMAKGSSNTAKNKVLTSQISPKVNPRC